MPIDDRCKIPEQVLLPIAWKHRHEKLKCDPEKWSTSDLEAIRYDCGPRYAHVPLDNIRRQCCNLRKRAKLGTLGETKNHGAAKRQSPPAEYLSYLRSEHWRTFSRTVRDFWEHSCALCKSAEKIDVHHNTYERLGHEKISDVVCLCRNCHKMADRARQRAAEAKRTEMLLV